MGRAYPRQAELQTVLRVHQNARLPAKKQPEQCASQQMSDDGSAVGLNEHVLDFFLCGRSGPPINLPSSTESLAEAPRPRGECERYATIGAPLALHYGILMLNIGCHLSTAKKAFWPMGRDALSIGAFLQFFTAQSARQNEQRRSIRPTPRCLSRALAPNTSSCSCWRTRPIRSEPLLS